MRSYIRPPIIFVEEPRFFSAENANKFKINDLFQDLTRHELQRPGIWKDRTLVLKRPISQPKPENIKHRTNAMVLAEDENLSREIWQKESRLASPPDGPVFFISCTFYCLISMTLPVNGMSVDVASPWEHEENRSMAIAQRTIRVISVPPFQGREPPRPRSPPA